MVTFSRVLVTISAVCPSGEAMVCIPVGTDEPRLEPSTYSRSYTVTVKVPGLPSAASPSASSAPDYTVSCKMATEPVTDSTNAPSFIPNVTVKNRGVLGLLATEALR
jgi:hypothetical protein